MAPADARGRVATLPEGAQPIATLGVERLLDYQGSAYAGLYLERLTAVAGADRELGGEALGSSMTLEAARHLALWMAFEDMIRVADLKTRGSRFERIAAEARLKPDQIAHATEYLHPRFEELCDALPSSLGERLLKSHRARRWSAPVLSQGRFVTTTRLTGFLLLWSIARLRRFRPRTLRYRDEQQRIEAWLASAINAARTDYGLGVEIIRLQRLVKGYGETHARGLRNFSTILALIPRLVEAGAAAGRLKALHEAALKDDEGIALGRAIRAQERQTGLAIGGPVIVHAKE
jgi:indolepyruvate ferredoxin oxidoreductase beta subunit